MPARLNRRRYREVVSMLKEVIADPKATRKERLRAGETLLAIYERHDRTEETKARRRVAEAVTGDAAQPSTPEPVAAEQSAEEAARAFLDRLNSKTAAAVAEEGANAE